MKVTLKDIAARCGVSPTVVSAVLNNRQGRISCSAQKRSEIIQTAKDLDYHPNLLARSMVLRHPPIVAVMLKSNTVGYTDGNYRYFVRHFPLLTRLLNEKGLEVLFAPYEDEEEQIRKFEHLSANGLAGGFITNVNPWHYKKMAAKLVAGNIPYVMLGYPKNTGACCVYYEGSPEFLNIYHRRHHTSKAALITMIDGELLRFNYPFPDNYMWLQEPHRLEISELNDRSCLFVCNSVDVYRRLAAIPEHVIIIDDIERRADIPARIPAILSDNSELVKRRMGVATGILTDWMLKDIKPATAVNVLKTGNAEYINWGESDKEHEHYKNEVELPKQSQNIFTTD